MGNNKYEIQAYSSDQEADDDYNNNNGIGLGEKFVKQILVIQTIMVIIIYIIYTLVRVYLKPRTVLWFAQTNHGIVFLMFRK